jgi:hypothetical protein
MPDAASWRAYDGLHLDFWRDASGANAVPWQQLACCVFKCGGWYLRFTTVFVLAAGLSMFEAVCEQNKLLLHLVCTRCCIEVPCQAWLWHGCGSCSWLGPH